MSYGKKICNTLKEIRQQIADKNDIKYAAEECHFDGECEGTCPKCESDLKYLEKELRKRTQLGKAVTIAGIATVSLGMAMSATTFSSCRTHRTRLSGCPRFFAYEEESNATSLNDENIVHSTDWCENNGENIE